MLSNRQQLPSDNIECILATVEHDTITERVCIWAHKSLTLGVNTIKELVFKCANGKSGSKRILQIKANLCVCVCVCVEEHLHYYKIIRIQLDKWLLGKAQVC